MAAGRLHMRRVSLFIFLITAFVISGTALASEANDNTQNIGEFLQTDQGEYIQRIAGLSDADPMLLAGNGDFNDFPAFGGDIYSAEHRSIGRAFLYSFIVPGLGEYYCDSKLKAGIFIAFEVLTWTQYTSNHSTGVKKEDEFQDFANVHWSATDYAVHLINEFGTVEDTLPGDKLPDMKTQQYYEMIGKYPKFYAGWDDYDRDSKESANQKRYAVMRDDANNKLNSARTWAMIALANHVLSAFDAALTAKRFNKKRDVFSGVNLKARLARYYDENIPQLVMTYRFY